MQLTEEQIGEYRDAFSLYDKDSDGKITISELDTVMRSLGQNPTEVELQKMLDKIDVDRNGTIEFEEFLQLMSQEWIDPEVETREAFKLFDKDGDGYVTAMELKQVMAALGERLTDQQIIEMMEEADSDKNGKISYDEFKKMMADKEPEA